MGSSVEPCSEVEQSQFRRSQSRVFFESDCSSPTSWEFRALASASSPVPMRLSLLRVSAAEASSKGEIRADGSRNSTGSSTGSQRSQDSGFSDSGETRGSRRNRSQQLNHNHSQSNEAEVVNHSDHNKSELLIQPLIDQSLTNSLVPHSLHQQFSSPSQTPAMVNESETSYIHYKTASCPHSFPNETECTNCIYQEIILARSSNGSVLSPLPTDISVGAPACCSTPKQSNINTKIRPSVMKKIDNFESLNKNKILDNNNNSNCTYQDSRRSSACYDSSGKGRSNLSVPVVSTASVKKLPSASQSVYAPGNSSGRGLKSLVCIHKKDGNGPMNKSEIYASRPSNVQAGSLSPKWRTLPKGFKKISAPDTSKEVIVVRSQADNESMRLWLHELRHQAEPECLYALQTKSIASESLEFSWSQQDSYTQTPRSPSRLNMTALAIHSISAPLLSIRNVEEMASVISGEFSKICKHLEFGFFVQVPALVESLSEQLDEFLKHFHESFGNLQKLEKRLATSCYELRLAASTLNDLIMSSSGIHTNGNPNISMSNPNSSHNVYAVIGHDHERDFHVIVSEIVEGVVALGNLFGQVVDQRLTRDLSAILDTIENGGLPARVGLKSYATVLSDGGMHICRLASSIRTVRGLLGVLLDAKDDQDKVLALRCLATILCVGEAVKDFDKAGGFEIVADILYEPSYSAAMKYEAVSVLTQATDPWIDLETSLVNLGFHLEKIIVSLTNMIPRSKTQDDLFLLTIAAISNLTFLEVSSLEILRRYRTVSFIVNVVREKPDFSTFILDHVATVLANMAGPERYRKDIVKSGGILTLLCFLQQRPSHLGSAAEITACERLQQKSVIALSRLINENGVANMVVEMNGMQRMIQLCRQEKERNYSDGVLIACLATLRKLVTFCGDRVVQGLHAEDLILPRLLDSFLLYSSRQESYV